MIFRIRTEQGEFKSHYHDVKRESMKQFVRLVLGFYIDRQIQSQELRESTRDSRDTSFVDVEKQLTLWEKEVIPSNAKGILEPYFRNIRATAEADNVSNIIGYEDLIYCMEKFLEEEGIMPGSKSYQLSYALGKIKDFNPEAGANKDKSEIYDNYAKKVGLIFYGFVMYLQSNIGDLIEMKNSTDNLLSEQETEEGSDGGGKDWKKGKGRGVRENLIGAEPEFDFNSIVNITKEVYSYFFEHKKDVKKAKISLTKFYNIYLAEDYKNWKNGVNADFLIGKTMSLTPEELDSLDSLIDKNFIDIKMKEIRGLVGDEILLEISQILGGGDIERQRVLSDFFALLVKSGYKLKVYENPYFNNLDSLKYSNITTLRDFTEAMEKTTIIRDEYSEFPLLKDYTLNDVVRYSKIKADRTIFKDSVSQVPAISPDVAISVASEPLDKRLVTFLEKIVELENPVKIEPNLGIGIDFEVVNGLNRDTIQTEDIRLAMKMLGKFGNFASLRQNLIEFGGICDLMLFNVRANKLNLKEPPEIIEKYMYRFLSTTTTLDGIEYKNRERLSDLWKMLKQVNRHILTVEADEVSAGSASPSNAMGVNRHATMHGVPFWDLRGDIRIPLVERNTQFFYIKVLGTPVKIYSKDLKVGRFHFRGQEYEADTEGVDILYKNEVMRYLRESGEDMGDVLHDSIIKELGRDIDMDSSLLADSIMDWANRNKSKNKPVTNKKRVNPISKIEDEDDDFFEGLDEVLDDNLGSFF